MRGSRRELRTCKVSPKANPAAATYRGRGADMWWDRTLNSSRLRALTPNNLGALPLVELGMDRGRDRDKSQLQVQQYHDILITYVNKLFLSQYHFPGQRLN